MMSGLVMKKEFRSNQAGQPLEQARLGQEALHQPSHPILAAKETGP